MDPLNLYPTYECIFLGGRGQYNYIYIFFLGGGGYGGGKKPKKWGEGNTFLFGGVPKKGGRGEGPITFSFLVAQASSSY